MILPPDVEVAPMLMPHHKGRKRMHLGKFCYSISDSRCKKFVCECVLKCQCECKFVCECVLVCKFECVLCSVQS